MLEFNFTPFPELKTERLVLRRMTTADAGQMFFLRSDDRVMKYIGREKTKSVEEAEDFIRKINVFIETNESIMWAIALNSDPAMLIGTICFWRLQPENFRAEVGYVLHPGYWNRGIMKESLLAVIKYGFEGMNLHSIEAHINPENIASGKVLENTGFVREAYFKENCYFHGVFRDTAIYSLLNK